MSPNEFRYWLCSTTPILSRLPLIASGIITPIERSKKGLEKDALKKNTFRALGWSLLLQLAHGCAVLPLTKLEALFGKASEQ